ncbi:MAG: hypothetical protein KDB14_10390 [Planctomycetales bacterium]|nr:hypothetical protein [Planctomycetales bacterium]
MRNTILICMAMVAPALSTSADELDAPKLPEIKESGSTRVAYHRFTLLRYNDTLLALHIMPDPQMGSAGIVYRWFHLTDGSDAFFRPDPNPRKRPDTLANSSVRTSTGETYEGELYLGSGQIKSGPIKIEWSQGSLDSGWLYLGKVTADIEIYPQQFEKLRDADGTLDNSKWVRIKHEK